jgi:hypothetical protein
MGRTIYLPQSPLPLCLISLVLIRLLLIHSQIRECVSMIYISKFWPEKKIKRNKLKIYVI